MVDKVLQQFADSFLDDNAKGQGYSEKTDNFFNQWLTQKTAELVYEDHQYYMNGVEMAKHLKKLFTKCEDSAMEKKFLAAVADAADKEDCTKDDLDACAKKLCKTSEKECDALIHKLEKMVGHEEDFKKELKEAGAVGGAWKDSKTSGKVVVHKKTGNKGLVVRTDKNANGGMDVVVAPLVGGTRPSYRNEKLWASGSYEATGETMKVDPPVAKTRNVDDED